MTGFLEITGNYLKTSSNYSLAAGHIVGSVVVGIALTALFGVPMAIYDVYTFCKNPGTHGYTGTLREKEYALLGTLDQWFGPEAWTRVSEIAQGKRSVFDFTNN